MPTETAEPTELSAMNDTTLIAIVNDGSGKHSANERARAWLLLKERGYVVNDPCAGCDTSDWPIVYVTIDEAVEGTDRS